MKKMLAIGLLVLLIASPAFAHSRTTTITNNITKPDDHNVLGAMVDAPNLVQLTQNTTLGLEGGKQIARDLFYPDDYGYLEADRGYFAYLKITYTGCLLNCKDK